MEWIKVEEGSDLPDYGTKVLVLGELKGMNPNMGGYYHVITYRADETKFSVKPIRKPNCDYQFMNMAYTAYWMPLPPKPQR